MSSSQARPITRSLDEVRAFIDPRLEAALDLSSEAAPRLVEAMRHSLLAPGKRLRPALVLWSAEACGGRWTDAAAAAVAVEMIHAYSLVHDDLPAMDDDDLRRGRPTCHRAFDEATAILCGDALQALAFETLARDMPPAAAARGCLVLARAAGPEALVGGQADDLAAERGWIASMERAAADAQVAWLERIHRRKTGALFLAALELGGLSAGASAAQLAALAAYGRGFGLAFQIADDLLDAEGDEATMGKRAGKDAGRGKLTFPTIVGREESRARARSLGAEAAAAVAGLGGGAAALEALALWIVARDH
ncbi:MAG: polyprenyl synthetase family protein [Planctomycetia bacterium]|nr:polyprenyl synthetase family protein [Planctomycetia bacterium]